MPRKHRSIYLDVYLDAYLDAYLDVYLNVYLDVSNWLSPTTTQFVPRLLDFNLEKITLFLPLRDSISSLSLCAVFFCIRRDVVNTKGSFGVSAGEGLMEALGSKE
jgi:hypothetical protein